MDVLSADVESGKKTLSKTEETGFFTEFVGENAVFVVKNPVSR